MRKLALAVLALFSVVAFAADAPLPPELLQAKTVYIVKGPTYPEKKDPTGNASYVEPCREELEKWGRFKVVSDLKDADLVIRISTQQHMSFMTINTQTRKSVDGYTILEVIQPSTRKTLWTGNRSWARSWSTKTSTKAVVKELEKRVDEQEAVGKAK